MTTSKHKRTVIFFSIFAVLAILIGVLIATSLNKSSGGKKGVTDETATVEPEDFDGSDSDSIKGMTATALIEEINLDNQTIVFLDLNSGEELSVFFGGSSDIRNRHNKIISATVLTIGYICDIRYSPDNMFLSSLKGSDKTWEYKGIRNLVIDDSLKKMTVADTIYRYDDRLRVLSNGSFKTLYDLDESDIFTLIGIDNYAYLLKVEQGHGSLVLAGAEDFIGGTLSVGRTRQFIISEDMNVILPEGTFDVIAENGEFTGEAQIRISRDCISTFDLSPFGTASVVRGEVNFNISPFGADLYIDGVRTSYSETVKLPYGSHTVEAVLGGYNTYSGSIDVNGASQTFNISLSPAPVEEVTDPDDITDDVSGSGISYSGDDELEDSTSDDDTITTQSPTPTQNPTEDSEADDSFETDVTPTATSTPTPLPEPIDDSKYHTIIQCTEGASVYINGSYAGVISGGSLIVPKQVGELNIKLELAGYATRSYSVWVESGNDDAEFSFPDLVRE